MMSFISFSTLVRRFSFSSRALLSITAAICDAVLLIPLLLSHFATQTLMVRRSILIPFISRSISEGASVQLCFRDALVKLWPEDYSGQHFSSFVSPTLCELASKSRKSLSRYAQPSDTGFQL